MSSKKYYILYQEKRRGNYFYLLNLLDGSLSRAAKPFGREGNFCDSQEILLPGLKKQKDYLRIRFTELDSHDFSKGITSLLDESFIQDILLEKIITARYITPRVHKLDYLNGVLSRKEINELKLLVKNNELENLNLFSFKFLERLHGGIIKSMSSSISSERLSRFIFPLNKV